MKTLRRSAFDWPAGRSKGAPQLVLSAGGRRIDTQATQGGTRGGIAHYLPFQLGGAATSLSHHVAVLPAVGLLLVTSPSWR